MGKRDRRRAVPAALIGYFSQDPDLENLWRSKIAVHRLAPRGKFESAAEDIVFSRWVYRDDIPQIENAGAAGRDDSLSDIEVHALRPVDRLQESVSNDLPADEWVKVAAFILSLFLPYPVMETALRNRAEEVDFLHDTAEGLRRSNRRRPAPEADDLERLRVAHGHSRGGAERRTDRRLEPLDVVRCRRSVRVIAGNPRRDRRESPAPTDEIHSFHHMLGAGLPAASDQERLEDQMLLFSVHNGIDPPDNRDNATTLVV